MFFRRILLVSAIGLGVLFAVKGSGERSRNSSQDIPSCSDIVRIFSWSQKNHGFASRTIQDPALAKKVAKLFSEQLDPHHLLFLESEVQELSQQVSQNWKTFIAQNDCRVFQSWLNRNLSLAKRRVEAKVSIPIKSNKNKKVRKYTSFPKTVEELDQRQTSFLGGLSFEKQPLRFFQKQVEEVLFPETVVAQTALVKATLGALDPYSTYFLDSEFSDFYEELSGRTAGVGITVEKSLQGLKIIEVTSKSPADLAGIKAEDQILEVDGHDLTQLSFRNATELLKGNDQTELQLTVENKTGRFSKTLLRTAQVFQDRKVRLEKIKTQAGKKVALISIPSFYGRGGLGSEDQEEQSSSEDLKNQIENLQEDGTLSALILDLRGNPGGYLEEAVTMAGFFLGPKVIVGVKDKEEMKTLKSDWDLKPIYRGPLVVWVDEQTASAGEILAAALKDHQRALLVGSPSTFGKGSVQKLIRLNDPFLSLDLENATGVLKLTTSVFFSPLGHSPLNGGVKTHVLLSEKLFKNMEKDTKPKMATIEDVDPLIDENQLQDIQEKAGNFKNVVEHIQKQERESSKTAMGEVFEIANQVSELSSL
ncbi:MAG: S41 family peptidase [Pseudomonadota bacterium]